ncbi:regulator [Aeromonas enteropelogenes]|uniref:regulator n=1 Tax=Aeromonas enteropelogenes TaxID=29489 RepID=UPI003BA1118A
MIIAPIHIDTPVCTVENFSERSGLTQRTIENYVRAGRIPIMPKQGRSEKVLINLVLYTQQAMNQPGLEPAPVRLPGVSRKQRDESHV